MEDAAGAVEQHGRIRHAGDDGADGCRLDRTDGADVLAGATASCSRHGTSAAAAMQMKTATARASEIGQQHQRAKREAGGEQDDGRMPQPVRPRCKEGGRAGIVDRHRAGFFLICNASAAPSGAGVATLAHIDALSCSSARRRRRAPTGAGASIARR